MIANFFNKSDPLKTTQLLVLLLVFYALSLLRLDNFEFSWGFVSAKIGIFLLATIYFVISDFIIRKNFLTGDNAYALLLIALFFGIFNTIFSHIDILISGLFLLFAFRKVYSLRSIKSTRLKLFDAGFWIGVAALIYAWSLWYIILIYVGIMLYKRHQLKNFFIPLVGAWVPIFVYYVFQMYREQTDIFYNHFYFDLPASYTIYSDIQILWPLIFAGFIALVAIVIVTPKITSLSHNFKNSWAVIIYHFILSIAIVYFYPNKNGSELLFLIFPLAVLITNLAQRMHSSILKNILLYAFLAIAVGIYAYNF